MADIRRLTQGPARRDACIDARSAAGHRNCPRGAVLEIWASEELNLGPHAYQAQTLLRRRLSARKHVFPVAIEVEAVKCSTLIFAILSSCTALAACASANVGTAAPSTPMVSVSQRLEMEDSAKAFINRATQLIFVHPDSAGIMDLYPKSGPITQVNQGYLTTSREEWECLIGRASHYQIELDRKTDLEIDTMKVDVLAAGAVAVTITYTGTTLDQRTRLIYHGAYTAVLALRDGKMRALQQHLSFPPH